VRRLLDGDCLHLHRPRYARRLSFVWVRHCWPHIRFIGVRLRSVMTVQELNGLWSVLEHSELARVFASRSLVIGSTLDKCGGRDLACENSSGNVMQTRQAV
jgi:hypothetical protein